MDIIVSPQDKNNLISHSHCTFLLRCSATHYNNVLHGAPAQCYPSKCYICTAAIGPLRLLTKSPTLAQDRHTLNLDESQMQVFRELQGKIKDILLAIKALATARRKGQGGAGGRDSEFEEV